MFTLTIEAGLQLALVSPGFSPRYLEIVRREREYLANGEPGRLLLRMRNSS